MQLPRRKVIAVGVLAVAAAGASRIEPAIRSARRRASQGVAPEDFGAVGDGVADDTAALQRALDTGETVWGAPGAIYLCTRTAGRTYALQLRSGMRWEGNGSTVKLADAQQPCALIKTVFTNAPGEQVSTSIHLRGKFDGNSTTQGKITPSDNYFQPTIYCDRVSECFFDIEILNAFITGFYSSGDIKTNTDNHLRATVRGGVGTGVNIVGTRWTVPLSDVADMIHDSQYAIGNSSVFNVRDSVIGDVFARNCGWGVKFQDSMARTSIGKVVNIAGPLTLNDFAVKFQGNGITAWNEDVTCDRVECEGHPATGLYLYANRRLRIGSYVGRGNGTNRALGVNDSADCQIIDSDLTINDIRSENASGVPVVTLGETRSVQVARLEVINPAWATMPVYAKANPAVGTSTVRIEVLSVLQTPPGWNAPHVAVEKKSEVQVGQIRTDASPANYDTDRNAVVVSYTPPTARVRAGPISWLGAGVERAR